VVRVESMVWFIQEVIAEISTRGVRWAIIVGIRERLKVFPEE
jgi:hypothetical protein